MFQLARCTLLTAAAFLGTVTYVQAQELLVLQPGPEGKDVQIQSVSPATNAGGSSMLSAMAWTWSGDRGAVRSLLQFDLSRVPPDAIVTKATLRLYGDASDGGAYPGHSALSGPNQGYIRRVTASWTETLVTWNTQPAATTTDQVVIPTSTSNTQSYALDVTSLVQPMLRSNHGFMILLATEEPYRALKFSSSDSPNATRRPRLDVTWRYRDEYAYEARIRYTPYSATDTVAVSLPQKTLASRYRLYKQPQGGNWSLVTEGDASSYTVSGLTNGIYRFAYSYRNLLTGAWSDTRMGGSMIVRRPPVVNLDGYSEIHDAHVATELYKAREKNFKLDGGELGYMGLGFFSLQGALTGAVCLDETQLQTRTNPLIRTSTSVDIIKDNEELADKIGLESSLNVSANYGFFQGSTNTKIRMLRETRITREYSMVMAKWEYIDENRMLVTNPFAALRSGLIKYLEGPAELK